MSAGYTFDECEIAPQRFELRRNGELVSIEPQAFEVLAYLVRNRGRIVSRDELLEAVWGTSYVSDAALATRIKEARRAIGDDGQAQRLIRTVHRRGFRFVGDVIERDEEASAGGQVRAARVDRAGIAPEWRAPPGRRDELERLGSWLAESRSAERSIVFVSGEPGIGKSTLIDAFIAGLAGARDAAIGVGHSLEHYGASEPYLPLLEAVGHLARGPHAEQVERQVRLAAPTWARQLPWLAADTTARAEVEPLTRERMLRELVEALDAIARELTLILVIEDIHWSDPSTLDVIDLLARRSEAARLLVIATIRTPDPGGGEIADARRLMRELTARGYAHELPVTPLDPAAVRAYLDDHVPGASAIEPVVSALLERTAGNPLFMRGLVDDWVRSGALIRADERWCTSERFGELDAAVPETILQLIEHQLWRLPADSRTALEAAALAGASITASVVAEATGGREDACETQLARLARSRSFIARAGLFEWPDGSVEDRYEFTHSLYAEVLAEGIPAGRRARMHRAIGQFLMRQLGPQAEARADEIAFHFLQSRDADQAVPALLLSARRAMARAAYPEARGVLERGLSLLTAIGDERRRCELEAQLQSCLGAVLVGLEGWGAAEAGHAYERALELARDLGERSLTLELLYALATVREMRGEYDQSERLIRERFTLGDPMSGIDAMESHELLACSLFHQGEFEESLRQAEAGLAIELSGAESISTPYGEHPAIACRGWSSLSLWFLGRADEAMERARRAVELAPDDPSRLHALAHAACVHVYRGEPQPILDHLPAVDQLVNRLGFRMHSVMAQIIRGWVRVQLGDPGGLAEMRAGIERHRGLSVRLELPYFLAIFAEACIAAGRLEEARAIVDEALEVLRVVRGRGLETEVMRLDAVLVALSGEREAALERLDETVTRSREQRARSIELRALTSAVEIAGSDAVERVDALERLMRDMDEGHDTRDWRRARELLERCGRSVAAIPAGLDQ